LLKKFIVGMSMHPLLVMHMDVPSNTDEKNQLWRLLTSPFIHFR